MKSMRVLLLACGLVGTLLVAAEITAKAQGYGRQYYGSWSYSQPHSYYYVQYYYKPYPTYASYDYHYCIYYPTYYPRYVYYYNPYRKVYWGRYDLEAKGYSLLAEKDRKGTIKEIDEKAFPAPKGMPEIPESEDKLVMTQPPAPPKTGN